MGVLKKLKSKGGTALQIVSIGALTGAFAGITVTLYSALVEHAEEIARDCYGFVRETPAFLPLLFLALFLGGIVIGGAVKLIPVLRGSGFPQTEGAALGLVRYRWYEALPCMFAASLLCVLCGLSAGSEGPGLMMGGACGYGLSDVTKRDVSMRRYQITGGACAGLAVALNAPLTGIVFAYEETYKRFTPEVFSCSFSSVVIALIVRNLLAPPLGLFDGPAFSGFSLAQTGLSFLPFALLGAIVCALLGAGFYALVFLFKKLLKKVRAGKWTFLVRMEIPFLLAGVAGLIAADAIGGGLHFIRELGAGEGIAVFGAPFWASVLVVCVLKYLLTPLNMAADMPCCASFPIMAVGAGTGALLSLVFAEFGMDPSFRQVLIVVCLCSFFTAVVQAPFTGIVMSFELTGSFTPLLPVIVGVAVSYFTGMLFGTEPLYERLLEENLEEKNAEPIAVRVTVGAGAGQFIRDILWPYSALVTRIERKGETVVPKGGTMLCEGDVLTVEGAPRDREEYLSALRSSVGEPEVLPPEPSPASDASSASGPSSGEETDAPDPAEGDPENR